MPDLPYIDPSVRFVGASALRGLNVEALENLTQTLVITTPERPLAVVLPYETYMKMQTAAIDRVRQKEQPK